MNYKVTGTLEEMTALENEIFLFGAPFSAVTYGQIWDDFLERYFESNSKVGGVVSWQGPQDEDNDVYSIIHIDMFTFSEKTIAEYVADIPEDEDLRTETQKAVIARVVEGYEEYTPQQYVSEVIIGNKYSIITM
jgi:hypothetical protein